MRGKSARMLGYESRSMAGQIYRLRFVRCFGGRRSNNGGQARARIVTCCGRSRRWNCTLVEFARVTRSNAGKYDKISFPVALRWTAKCYAEG